MFGLPLPLGGKTVSGCRSCQGSGWGRTQLEAFSFSSQRSRASGPPNALWVSART